MIIGFASGAYSLYLCSYILMGYVEKSQQNDIRNQQ